MQCNDTFCWARLNNNTKLKPGNKPFLWFYHVYGIAPSWCLRYLSNADGRLSIISGRATGLPASRPINPSPYDTIYPILNLYNLGWQTRIVPQLRRLLKGDLPLFSGKDNIWPTFIRHDLMTYILLYFSWLMWWYPSEQHLSSKTLHLCYDHIIIYDMPDWALRMVNMVNLSHVTTE